MRCVLLALLFAVGCGAQAHKSAPSASYSMDMPESAATEAYLADDTRSMSGTEDEGGRQAGEATIPSLPRKIIYTATVDLVVEDFEPVPAKVQELADQFEGYVARSNLEGSPGQRRNGSWTLRVPVERYRDFLEAAQKLGEVRRINSDSKDITEEFYDVQARLKNKKREEERLLVLLEEATGHLKDILDVERELSRVRGEIEQFEGRLRVMENLSSLTTIELRVQEIKDYVPEAAPTYLTRMRRAVGNSLRAFSETAQAISIGLVAALPWLLTLGLLLALTIWLLRMVVRRLLGRRPAKP